MTGIYRTSINIHNPQTYPVQFCKKIVRANPEICVPPMPGLPQRLVQICPPPPKPVITTGKLGSDLADRVDCRVIKHLLGLPTDGTDHVEGFVVIEVPPVPGKPQPVLDVVGKYTARPTGGEVEALDVVVYREQTITP